VEEFVGLEHEVGGLDVVAVGVVIGDGLPWVGEVEIHNAGLDADFVANDGEEFFETRAQGGVGPYLVELSESLEQMNVGVHRFVIYGPDGVGGDGAAGGMRIDGCAVARQPLVVAAVIFVVGMLVDPEEAFLGEVEGFGIGGSLPGCREAVDAETDAIEMFVVAEGGSDVAAVVETPVEAALLLVPHHAGEEVDAVMDDGNELLFHCRFAEDYLRSDPCHASLENGELTVAGKWFPVAREVGVEAAVYIVDGAREPEIENLGVESGVGFGEQFLVRGGIGLYLRSSGDEAREHARKD